MRILAWIIFAVYIAWDFISRAIFGFFSPFLDMSGFILISDWIYLILFVVITSYTPFEEEGFEFTLKIIFLFFIYSLLIIGPIMQGFLASAFGENVASAFASPILGTKGIISSFSTEIFGIQFPSILFIFIGIDVALILLCAFTSIGEITPIISVLAKAGLLFLFFTFAPTPEPSNATNVA